MECKTLTNEPNYTTEGYHNSTEMNGEGNNWLKEAGKEYCEAREKRAVHKCCNQVSKSVSHRSID